MGLDMNQTKITAGEIPMIGASEMCSLHIGWISPDPKNSTPEAVEGINVSDYFDSVGRYKGADEKGVEPIFREMTKEEIEEYLR